MSIRDEITFGENDDLLLAAEVVRQYGQTRVVNDVIVPDDHDRRAWGGQVTARYQLSNEGLKPYIQGRFVYFGGDKRSSKSVEGFDPFFFGWADWGQWWIGDMTSFAVPHNNARIFNFELGLELTDVSMLRLYYFNTSLLEELDNGSLAAAQPMYTKAWSHEVNVVYDYSFNGLCICRRHGRNKFPPECG